MHKYELSIRDYWRIVKKRRGVIILTALIFAAATLAVTLIQRPKPLYTATASVKVDRSTSITGLFIEVLSVPTGDTLATQALIIKSAPVLEKVAKELGLIPREGVLDEAHTAEKYGKIILELQNKIKTEQEGNTSVINVTASADEPGMARKIANLVVEKYREESILSRNRQIFEAKKFIEEQLTIVEQRLRTAEDSLNGFKRSRGIVSISDEQKAELERLSGLESGKEKLDLDIKENEYNLNLLKEGRSISDKSMARLFADADPYQSVISKLNARMSELLLERDNLLIGLTPAHPQVREVDAKIANVRAELASQLESKRSALLKKKELMSADIAGLKGGLQMLPAAAMELNRLEREVKINQELFSLLKTKYQEALIKEAERVEEVSIIRNAIEPTVPKNPPRIFAKGALGLVLGVIFGLVFAFVFESLDTSIGTIEDVEEFLGTPVIGVIPNLNTGDVSDFLKENYRIAGDWQFRVYQSLISHFMPRSIAAECYRSLRTNVLFTATEKSLKSIMVTGSSVREGKTITALNLAIVLAQVGKRVLLIDADFRNPSIHQYFGLEREPGLSNVILGNISWQEAARTITDIMLGDIEVDDLMATPGMDNINIVTSGLHVTQPSEFLNSSRLPNLLEEMKKAYDFVIIDAPPVLPVADAVILGNKVDGIFMIYEAGKVARNALKRTKFLLENVGANILGVILNNLSAESSPDFHQGGMYRYYSERRAESKKLSDRVASLKRKIKSERR
ncbi:MAG TPA: polysaccharide biosynthesis tyrosine autokinase [Dissulfurispiraceae bacterium]